jgi:hypothetical protein
VRPSYRLTGPNVLSDIDELAGVLDIAISCRDTDVIALAVRTLRDQLQDLADHYPDAASGEVSGGLRERALARATMAALTQTLQRVGDAAAAGRFDEAAGEYLNYRKLTAAAAPLALQAADPWSLFDQVLHAAHRQSARVAAQPPSGRAAN